MKSRSKQAARKRMKKYVLSELKATAVVLLATIIFFLSYQISLGAEINYATPSSYDDIIYSIEMNEYGEIFKTMSAEDWDYLARCVMCEAGQSNLECAEGTVCVILNRVLDQTRFGNVNTVSEVVNQPGQFVTRRKFKKVTPNALTYAAISNVQNHGARVIRDKLAEQGWDFAVTDYLFFATNKQRYATDHIMCGLNKPGQKHWLGRAK